MAAVLDEVGKSAEKLVDEEKDDIVDEEDDAVTTDASKKKKKKKKKKKTGELKFLNIFRVVPRSSLMLSHFSGACIYSQWSFCNNRSKTLFNFALLKKLSQSLRALSLYRNYSKNINNFRL